jgi:flagellar basal body-associated protein FliL
MKVMIIIGVVLALLGLVGIAIPVFTTTQTKEVAKLGNLQLKESSDEPHIIPPLLSEGALVLGVVLIGLGAVLRR